MRTSRMTALAALLLGTVVTTSALAAGSMTELPPSYAPGDSKLKWGGCPEGMPKGCQIAVLSGDPSKPGADIFLKIPGKAKTPSHKHSSAERIVVVEGEMSVKFEGHNATKYKRGTYLYNPADTVHEAQCVSATPCVLFISWEKPVDMIPTPMASAAETGKPAAATAAATEKKPKKGGC